MDINATSFHEIITLPSPFPFRYFPIYKSFSVFKGGGGKYNAEHERFMKKMMSELHQQKVELNPFTTRPFGP